MIVNPITWFDSVVWGQVDSFGTVFLLLAVRELWKARRERAAILAVVAALVKPQLGDPRPDRRVRRRSAGRCGPTADTATSRRPSRRGSAGSAGRPAAIRIVSTGVAGFVTAVVLSAPFGLSVVSFSGTAPFVDSSLVRLIFSTAATYSYVTVNAYNLWALFPRRRRRAWPPTAAGSSTRPCPDATSWASIGPFPAAARRRRSLLGAAAVRRHPVRSSRAAPTG